MVTWACVATAGCMQTADTTINNISNKQTNVNFPCLNPPKISSFAPGDTLITSQDGLNCFAWQTFIALNWRVDPSKPGKPDNRMPKSEFGKPGTEQTTVWETYANIKNVMRPNAEPPLPWGENSAAADACSLTIKGKKINGPVRFMSSSRQGGRFNLSEDTAQAFPSSNPNWLADKDGNIVYYEILMGKDEYDYISTQKLYNLNEQVKHVKNKKNISLPLGHNDTLGGLELKAAWLRVSDNDRGHIKWQQFKTTKAYVYDEKTRQCAESTMALVGLHIIHKTASQPQWVWATFEHINNAPDTSKLKSNNTVEGDYTFYNNVCSVRPVPAACTPKKIAGKAVTKTSCEPNISPAYYLTGTNDCPAYPVRVSRDFTIKDTTDNHVATLNKAVKSMIMEVNQDSVFANYELVNVLWSSAAVNDNVPPGNPPVTPLSISGETPALTAVPVANTMLETYAQGFNCLSCHKNASISSRAGKNIKKYATDYSFTFGFANKPKW